MTKTKFLIFIFLLITLFIFPENFQVIFKENTLDEEANRIWFYIKKIEWYEENGYNIVFPKHKIVEELLKKSRKNKLNNNDYENFFNIFKNEIYDKTLYQKSLEKVKNREDKIIETLNKLKYFKEKWNFKLFNTYSVKLTLYGTGGSYNHNNGEVILWTDSDGSFERESNPDNNPLLVIIHEIVHIGIEENIVKKYNLSHFEKERVVKKFIDKNLKDILPDYKIYGQKPNDYIDKYLDTKSNWDNLPFYISEYIKNKR